MGNESLKRQTYTLDVDGKLVARTMWDDTRGLTTRYNRDLLGRIIVVTNPLGNQWAYTYDLLRRRVGVNDPDLGTWSYVDDAASRLVSLQHAKGTVLAPKTTTNTRDQSRSGIFNPFGRAQGKNAM